MSNDQTVGRCRTCIFWGELYGYDDPRMPLHRICTCPKTQIPEIPDDDETDREVPVPLDTVIDREHSFVIVSGPEFGCIHHEVE